MANDDDVKPPPFIPLMRVSSVGRTPAGNVPMVTNDVLAADGEK